MCIFNEKLDEEMLEKLQDYEFAVCHHLTYKTVYGITKRLLIYISNGFQMPSLLMRREKMGGSFIILQRQENWITFSEIYIIKFWVCIL